MRGLRLRSEAIRAVLGVPASDLRDRTLPLEALLPAGLARTLTGWLGDGDGDGDGDDGGGGTGDGTALGDGGGDRQRQPAAIDAWLRGAEVDARVRAAVRCLWSDPERDVALVAGDVGLSGRQLRRLLMADLGLGPKLFQRVGRLQRFLAIADALVATTTSMEAGATAGVMVSATAGWVPVTGQSGGAGDRSLADLAAMAGYADQAHMSREVRALAGTTPARLLRERAGATPPSAGRTTAGASA